jgi:hypothetical protein
MKVRGFFTAYHFYLAIAVLRHGIVGPLPTAQGNFMFGVVAVEYFTLCPEELANKSARVLVGSSRENEEVDTDLVEIDRLDAVANLLKYQKETKKWRINKVSLKNIQVRDFVLKRKKNADSVGKLQFVWEGPYSLTSGVRDRHFVSRMRKVWIYHIR